MSFPGGDTILVAAGNYPRAVTMTLQPTPVYRKRCVRWVRKGSFAQNGHAGRNGKSWSGRLKGKAQRRARYRASLRARDSSGKRSKSKRIRFRIVRR